MILQQDDENAIDKAYKRRKSLKQNRNKKDTYIQNQKRQLRFLRHTIRKDFLENLKLTGHIENKRERGKQQVSYLAYLCEWMGERGFDKWKNFAKKLKEVELSGEP